MSTVDFLEELLQDELKDIYDAEKQLTKALPTSNAWKTCSSDWACRRVGKNASGCRISSRKARR